MGETAQIGRRVPRADAIPRVTGEAVYAADISLPGMLHGATVGSPHAHARVVAVDASRALATTGVRAVLTVEGCSLFSRHVRYPGQMPTSY